MTMDERLSGDHAEEAHTVTPGSSSIDLSEEDFGTEKQVPIHAERAGYPTAPDPLKSV